MELHYGKFQLLGVRCNPDIHLPDNTCIQTQQCMMYLGTMMTADGKHGNKLSRRIGIAKKLFCGTAEGLETFIAALPPKSANRTKLWLNQGSSIACAHWF